MLEFWEGLVGAKVCGGYLLRRLIGSTDDSAIYRTAYGEAAADLKLVRAGGPAATGADVPTVEHPQIMRLFASRRGEAGAEGVGTAEVLYFVTEAADENLGSVIGERALTAEEAAEMLSPVLSALSYLHGRGLAHGRIKPANILAIGDTVKLSVDSVRPAGAVASPEEDMRALGLTIIEVMTQERQPSAIAQVPQPLRDIVEHSLQPNAELQWTAKQAALRLSGKSPESISAPAPPVTATPTAATAATGAPSAVHHVAHRVELGKRAIPLWALPAAGVVMVLAMVFALSRSTGSSANSGPTTGVVNMVPAPVAAPPVVVPVPRPKPPKPTPFEAPNRIAPKPAAPAPKVAGSGWFVVVASYTREADAAQEARLLAKRFPQFKPSVFPPSAIDTHYLVIVGSGLSADGADRLQARAVASGLPRDTYVKKYPSQRK